MSLSAIRVHAALAALAALSAALAALLAALFALLAALAALAALLAALSALSALHAALHAALSAALAALHAALHAALSAALSAALAALASAGDPLVRGSRTSAHCFMAATTNGWSRPANSSARSQCRNFQETVDRSAPGLMADRKRAGKVLAAPFD
jgi:hypothetical protein